MRPDPGSVTVVAPNSCPYCSSPNRVVSPPANKMSVWVDNPSVSMQTDSMVTDGLLTQIRSTDPASGLRAAGALRRLADLVEATHVEIARQQGWSWEQIGDALGVSRQSVHAKYGK
jgi:hypothetical protein